jgi:hypothetical protein
MDGVKARIENRSDQAIALGLQRATAPSAPILASIIQSDAGSGTT